MKAISIVVLGAISAPLCFGQSAFKTLHSFNGLDGGSPNCVIQGADGFFYGTAALGGNSIVGLSDGGGTIFRMSSTGATTVLHAFSGTDGYEPNGIIQAPNGILYGATRAGGQPTAGGGGTVYKITTSGAFQVLHAFIGGFGGTDGGGPSGPPIMASDGFLYGVTAGGGTFRDIDHQGGFGTAYKIDPATGATTIIHSFNINDPNGIFPSGRLIQGTDGAFYGTTREGGLGGGTVFRMTSAGVVTLLKAITDSGEPLDGVIQASDGMLYGTTDGGGAGGTVFRVSTTGTNYKVLNRFDGRDGWRPHFGVFQPAPGLLYGSTPEGGMGDLQGGDIYRLGTGGTLVVLHSFFYSGTDGIIPNSRLVLGNDGALYGTNGIQGVNGHGTVFRIDQRVPGFIASISVPSKLMTSDVGTGTVTLSAPAPIGGRIVAIGLQSYQATTPSSITIPAGATTGTFKIQVGNVGADQTFRVYASTLGQGIRTSMTLLMLPNLTSLAVSPASIAGGGTSTATIVLSRAAPMAGATISLISSSTKATVPTTVKVPGGATSVTFTVKTMHVKSTSSVTITANYNFTTANTVLTITP